MYLTDSLIVADCKDSYSIEEINMLIIIIKKRITIFIKESYYYKYKYFVFFKRNYFLCIYWKKMKTTIHKQP